MEEDLKAVESHFAFGENWASYARLIDQARLDKARGALIRLLGADGLKDRVMIDIGCGSGLHAAAAQTLGAKRVVGMDIDPNSVATSQQVFAALNMRDQCTALECSIFDVDGAELGKFDVVYSWGVLHHTGAMQEAIAKAAGLTATGGLFAFALYRKTRLCWFWALEKQWYAKALPHTQRIARRIYIFLKSLGYRITGRSVDSLIYDMSRGMDFEHDVHDWLGGYPYESIAPEEVAALMEKLGFDPVRSFTRPGGWAVFGSGCDEYVYRRR